MTAAGLSRHLFGRGPLRSTRALLAVTSGARFVDMGLFGGQLTCAADPAKGRIRVDLAWPDIIDATVTRVHADGTTFGVRGGSPAIVADAWARYDYEAPLDVDVTYQATSPQRPGVTLTSTPVRLDGQSRFWFKSITSPYLNRRVRIYRPGARGIPERQGILRPPDRPDPIVVYQIRGMDTGTISMYIADTAEELALRALLADGGPLLLQYPGYAGGENLYLAVGAAGIAPIIEKTADLQRVLSINFDVQLPPPGDAFAGEGGSYGDVHDLYPTYNHQAGAGLTYLELSMLG